MKSFIKSFILEYWSMFVVWLVTMAGIMLLMASCSPTANLNRSVVFTMAGSTWSIDHKYVHQISASGRYAKYRTDDPKMAPILEAAQLIERSNRTQMAGR